MIREITYTLNEKGIIPSIRQFGGMQGEHRATRLIFTIGEELAEKLSYLSEKGELKYRIDGYNAEGGVKRSDSRELVFEDCEYYLEEWFTRFSGTAKAVMVITLLKDNETEMELYSFPATLEIKPLPDGTEQAGDNQESMTTLAETARENAKRAEQAKEMALRAQALAEEAQRLTEEAERILETDTIFVIDGGGAKTQTMAELIVDGDLSAESDNPVQNKVLKAEFDTLSDSVAQVMSFAQQNFEAVNTNAEGIRTIAEKTQNDLAETNDILEDTKQTANSNKGRLDLQADYIVEQGTSGIWTYRKWNSGIVELFGKKDVTFEKDTGNSVTSHGFYASGLQTVTLPFRVRGTLTGMARKGCWVINGIEGETPNQICFRIATIATQDISGTLVTTYLHLIGTIV